MKGRIKFIDKKTKLWGFIIPDDGSPDVHFNVSDFAASNPTIGPGCIVEFDLEESAGSRHASSLRVSAPSVNLTAKRNAPGEALTQWAFVPFIPFRAQDGDEYSSVAHYLAKKALDERWYFGEGPDSGDAFPILENYLKYTFHKLQNERAVVEHRGRESRWAAFNTGLVDELYDPIFALFKQNTRDVPEWSFYDFCVPGKGRSGKQLTAIFDPLPPRASYFANNFETLLDTSKDIHVDYEHVIIDGIRRDRFPPTFVESHYPRGWVLKNYRMCDCATRMEYLRNLADAIKDDLRCMREIKNRLEDAKVLAEKRVSWNFKTAIPQYYPRFDTMSLLLPLAIVNDEKVDIALVVTRNPSGSYQGRTVLPLAWAYKNARLVCRPDSDWLIPSKILPEEVASDEDE